MLVYKEDDANGIVELTVGGKITRDEFNDVARKMDAFIKKHGKVKILEDIREYPRMSLSTMFAASRFSAKHMKSFTHCAYVTDSKWIGRAAKAGAKLAGPLVKTELKSFKGGQMDDARTWLKKQQP